MRISRLLEPVSATVILRAIAYPVPLRAWALAIDNIGPYFGALQLRYFGPRPLIENNSVRSQSTNTLNGTGGYKITPTIRIQLEGFNLTNRKDSAIDYYYESRLKSEPAGAAIPDIHFHPIESRSLRVRLTATF